MRKLCLGLPVSACSTEIFIIITCHLYNAGEPTLQQQAILFIAALGLGKPASVTANRNRTLSITRRMVDPIQSICGSPSSEICVSSKLLFHPCCMRILHSLKKTALKS